MWVLQGWGGHGDMRRGNLGLTMQSERYGLWCWLTGWRGWWHCKVILGAILRRYLLGLLPIYPSTEASYSLLNRSHGLSKLIDGNYLWIHTSLIWSLVWLVWYPNQSTPNFDPRSRTQTERIDTPTTVEILNKIQGKGNFTKNVYQMCRKVTRKQSNWYPILSRYIRDHYEDN